MEQNLIRDLQNENNFAFGELYKQYFPTVKNFILKNSGSVEDAEDVFQDSLLVFVEKLRLENFQLSASAKTYLVAITKNIWFKKLRNKKEEFDFSLLENEKFHQEIDESIENEKSYKDKLQNLLHKITKHCEGLIHDMFFKEKSVEEIQKKYGYSNKHTLQNQKYKCVEQIKKVKEEENL